MNCKKCGSEWKTSSSVTVCPFCSESLAKKEEPRFYDNSREALAAIMKMYGADVLLGNLNAHFPDFAPSVSTGDRRLVYAVYELGAAQVLKNNLTTPQADKERAVKIAARKLTDAFIVPYKAEAIVYEFAVALGWQVDKPESPIQQFGKPTNTVSQPNIQSQSVSMQVPSVTITDTGIVTEILQGKRRNLQFGSYKWRVLDVQSDKVLLITEDVIEKRRYHAQGTGITWKTCDLRKYLNGEFLQKFTEEERRKITETPICNTDNLWYGTKGGNDTVDKIFLLSLEEVDRYFGDSGDYKNKRRKKYDNGKWVADSNGWYLSNANDSDRGAKDAKGEACWWWLRSPGNPNTSAVRVGDGGSVTVTGGSVRTLSGGVRPAFWLNLKS